MVVTEPLASDTETGSKVDEAEIILLEVEPMFAATSEASFDTLLLGTHLWTVYNDSCSNSLTYTRDKGSLIVFLFTFNCTLRQFKIYFQLKVR